MRGWGNGIAACAAATALAACSYIQVLTYTTDDQLSGFDEDQSTALAFTVMEGHEDAAEAMANLRDEIERQNILNADGIPDLILKKCLEPKPPPEFKAEFVAPVVVAVAGAAFDEAVSAIEGRRDRLREEAKRTYTHVSHIPDLRLAETDGFETCIFMQRTIPAEKPANGRRPAMMLVLHLRAVSTNQQRTGLYFDPIYLHVAYAAAATKEVSSPDKPTVKLNAALAITALKTDNGQDQLDLHMSHEYPLGSVEIGTQYVRPELFGSVPGAKQLSTPLSPLFTALPDTVGTVSLAVTERGTAAENFGDLSDGDKAIVQAIKGAFTNFFKAKIGAE